MVKKFFFFMVGMVLTVMVLAGSGCGYTTKSLLPENIRSVYVEPVKNTINLSGELGENERFRVYRPGMEVDLTNAIINRFVFDGTLKVKREGEADAVVEAKLIDYRRDPLRYSDDDDVQEYRLSVSLDVVFYEAATRKVIWRSNLVGDTTFFLSGSRSVTEDEAAAKAVEDVARRVVEHTLEVW